MADQSDEVEKDPPPNTLSIITFIGCGLCGREKPENVSNEDYARLHIGATPWGIQVWCSRHEVNVMHIDFEGVRHKANTTMESLIN